MIDYAPLLSALRAGPLRAWAEQLPAQIERQAGVARWGDLPRWRQALADLPELTPSSCDFSSGVRIGTADDCSAHQRQQVQTALMALHPWRKGPWEAFGLHVDSEWRSDWKWQRVQPHLTPLRDRLVLDVGCGNGYYCWRMHGAGARRVIGIDPSQLFTHQFYALKHYVDRLAGSPLPVDVLPLGIEDLPAGLAMFDTVFSMGVFYHRRSPMDHLRELKDLLRPGGELVLETLVIAGGDGQVLVPPGRYAKMANIWFIPTPASLLGWLRKCGFVSPRLVDLSPTGVAEQRTTDWMRFESLVDFLDPVNPALTVEGHPAPVRATFVAAA